MKNPISSQARKRIIRLSKHLKSFVKPFPRYGNAINAVVLLAFVMLVVGGAAALTVHTKKPQTVVLKQASSTNKTVSKPAATPTPTTQPAQTTTPSTPATTTTPKPSTSSSTDDPQADAIENHINFMLQCDSDMSTAYDTYSAVVTSAENTYNTDLANEDQQAESDYPAGSYTLSEVESNIMNGEITKYNATVAPAYATYLSAMNTINSRGCNLTPVSESLYGTSN